MIRLVGALLAVVLPSLAAAQSPRMVRVSLEVREASTQSREAVQGGGRVIITDRGGTRARAGVGADAGQTRISKSTGVFTLVQDGGESSILVAQSVPHPQVAIFRDYATGAGYIGTGVAFRDVGTSLRVRVALLPNDQIRVRLTPSISYFSPSGDGIVDFTEATTELVVRNGRPVVIGGTTSQVHQVTRQVLGFLTTQSSGETAFILTATVR
jgi:hypothetical protein